MAVYEKGFGQRTDGMAGVTVVGTPDALSAALYRMHDVEGPDQLTPFMLRMCCVNLFRAAQSDRGRPLAPLSADIPAREFSQWLTPLGDVGLLDPDQHPVRLQIVELQPDDELSANAGRLVLDAIVGPPEQEPAIIDPALL